MIVSFRHKGLEGLYHAGSGSGVQSAHVPKLMRILAALDAASSLDDLNHPGYWLHPLKGQLHGYYFLWGNCNWRVMFRFFGTDVELVDYQDYH